jgi:NTE family protein
MTYNFKNLVFEGGGVKGVAYVGALEILQQKGILGKIERVGGTSAGAINAVLLGLGCSADETKSIIGSLNMSNFLDDSWGIIRDINRFMTEFGWYKGDALRKWIGEVIEKKTGNSESTFEDINRLKAEKGFKDIFMVTTNLSTGYFEIFSHEHTPKTCVADAVRLSMSIPLFFAAKRSVRGDVYVDGGVLANYPIKLFDREKYVGPAGGRDTDYYAKDNAKIPDNRPDVSRYVYNKETLGFRLESAEKIAIFRDHGEPAQREIDDIFDYGQAFIETVWNALFGYHLHKDDWHRTIYIDTKGVKTTDFDISDAKKQELITSGRDGTTKYFEWFDKDWDDQDDDRPLNK